MIIRRRNMRRCLKTIIIAAFCILAFNSTSHAIGRRVFVGGCSTGSCAAPIVHHEVAQVITPVFAYPLLIPAYQFQYVAPAYATATVPVVQVTGYPVASPIVQPVAPFGYPGYPT